MVALARFCQNNLAAADTATNTFSGAVSGFPGSNILDPKRNLKWIMAGRFVVISSNKNIYINDGTNKTVALTEATYATGTLLAAHIQTQLNASSSNWTCSYSSTTGKFTIGRSSGTSTLRLTQTTNASWDMLGYTGGSDVSSGVALAANERRNHTSEEWHVDLGSAKTPTCFFLIGPADTDFSISSTATILIEANNVDDFAAAPLSISLTAEQTGVFYFFASILDTTYRFWRCKITDRTNPDGPQLIINQGYLGDYSELTNYNISNGFRMTVVDQSLTTRSESGVPYWKRVQKYCQFDSVGTEFISDEDRVELLRIFRELGISTPFFFALDPSAVISNSVGEMTKYVSFDESPDLSHIRFKYYSYSMKMREVV